MAGNLNRHTSTVKCSKINLHAELNLDHKCRGIPPNVSSRSYCARVIHRNTLTSSRGGELNAVKKYPHGRGEMYHPADVIVIIVT